MSQNNPQVEKLTIWGFTEEEIERRWEVHFKFDPVNRFCGSSDDPDNEPPANLEENNSEQMLGALERLLSQGGSDE